MQNSLEALSPFKDRPVTRPNFCVMNSSIPSLISICCLFVVVVDMIFFFVCDRFVFRFTSYRRTHTPKPSQTAQTQSVWSGGTHPYVVNRNENCHNSKNESIPRSKINLKVRPTHEAIMSKRKTPETETVVAVAPPKRARVGPFLENMSMSTQSAIANYLTEKAYRHKDYQEPYPILSREEVEFSWIDNQQITYLSDVNWRCLRPVSRVLKELAIRFNTISPKNPYQWALDDLNGEDKNNIIQLLIEQHNYALVREQGKTVADAAKNAGPTFLRFILEHPKFAKKEFGKRDFVALESIAQKTLKIE